MNRSIQRLIVTARQCASSLAQRNVAHFTFTKDQPDPSLGPTKEMNLCQTIQNALDITLASDHTASEHRLLSRRRNERGVCVCV